MFQKQESFWLPYEIIRVIISFLSISFHNKLVLILLNVKYTYFVVF